MATTVRIGRVYDEPQAADGRRVLVDRLWPRGLSKEKAHLDAWLREVAPTTELRRWYDHDREKHDEFVHRYEAELADDDHAGPFAELRALSATHDVLLLTASKTLDLSHAAVLAHLLALRPKNPPTWLLRATTSTDSSVGRT